MSFEENWKKSKQRFITQMKRFHCLSLENLNTFFDPISETPIDPAPFLRFQNTDQIETPVQSIQIPMHYYVPESYERREFFTYMKSFGDLNSVNDDRFLAVGSAILRAVNIIREAFPKERMKFFSEEKVGKYIFRGLWIEDFDLEKLRFQTNFNSFSDWAYGAENVLNFYRLQKKNHKVFNMILEFLFDIPF